MAGKDEDKELEFEESWDNKYYQICLDSEIYPNGDIPWLFLIVTRKELARLVENTNLRIQEYNITKPEDICEYE